MPRVRSAILLCASLGLSCARDLGEPPDAALENCDAQDACEIDAGGDQAPDARASAPYAGESAFKPGSCVAGRIFAPAALGTLWTQSSQDDADFGARPEQGEAWLGVPVDGVEAETSDGRAVRCALLSEVGGFSCADDREVLVAVRIWSGEQLWTREVPAADPGASRCLSPSYFLDGLLPCSAPDHTVLEGRLLGYEPVSAPPASVFLVSVEQPFVESEQGTMVSRAHAYRPCQISGDRYACPPLDQRASALHWLIVAVGDHVTRRVLTLEANACESQLMQADVEACPLQTPALLVEIADKPDPPAALAVSASYEGGAPYPCVNAGSLGYFCPAALGSKRGVGRYEITARAGEHVYSATYVRSSDGCVTTNGPVQLTRSGS